MKINIITKLDIEKLLKERDKKLIESLNKTFDKKLKEKEKEKARFEKEAIKKQSGLSDRAWNKVKNKELRLSEIEHKIINIEEFLKDSSKQSNEFVKKFNQHVESNNANFEGLKGYFKK